MSKYVTDNPKLVLGVTLGVGAAAIGLSIWYKKKLDNTPPKKWRLVGELLDLVCYPVKSCGPVRVGELQCTVLGLEDGLLKDRTFMVTTESGNFAHARIHPRLVLIKPKIVGETLTLSSTGMPDISINIKQLVSKKAFTSEIWDEGVNVIDCGDEVAKWISQFIFNEDTGLRLAYYPKNYPTRDLRIRNPGWPGMTKADSGALHDETSFMMMSESSVSDLNNKLDKNVSASRFRPNFVVRGTKAFEEDNWKWIRIGDTTIFRNVRPCARCIFINIDPETGIRDAQEPLKTLRSYRKHPRCADSPLMGIHLGIRVPGKVSLGDLVYVA